MDRKVQALTGSVLVGIAVMVYPEDECFLESIVDF